MSISVIALIVAAGVSRRFGGGLPKPYMEVGDSTILGLSIQAFANHPAIDGVRVVINREHHPLYRSCIMPKDVPLFPCVIGGATRQESVRLGLESVMHCKPRFVLIHDAARPLVSKEIISRVVEALKEGEKAVLPTIPVVDTLKRVGHGYVESTVPRTGLMAAQTPQGFDFNTILALHRQFAGEECTDDVMLAERAHIRVRAVAGEPHNFKITTQEDFQHLQSII